MNEIVFVTHNKGKIASASRQLEGVNFKVFEYDLEEPSSLYIFRLFILDRLIRWIS